MAQAMKTTLHKMVLIVLIRLSPKLFKRYYKEYKEVYNKYLRSKATKEFERGIK